MSALKDLFSSPKKTATPSSITTPGYNIGSNGTLTRTGMGADYDTNIQGILGELNGLQGDVMPGYGALTDARVQAAQDAGTSSLSNLRGDLARRKILGSSFANDSIQRAELETGKQVGQARAQSFLEELDASMKIITQKFAVIGDAMKTNLSELGASSAAVASLNNMSLQAQQIYQQMLAGAGQLAGTVVGAGVSQFGAGGAFGQGGAFGSPSSSDALMALLTKGAASGLTSGGSSGLGTTSAPGAASSFLSSNSSFEIPADFSW